MQTKNKVTISDIAAATGLSKTTVSRFINGKEHLMSESSRQKLRAAIEQMQYRPSSIARSLKSKRTNTVGVVVADISSPWSSAVIGGITDVLISEQYVPIFVSSGETLARERGYIDSLLAREIDGLIVNTANDQNPFLIEVAQSGLPVVLCDRFVRDHAFDIVSVQNDALVRTALLHLKQQGFDRPVFFTSAYAHNSARYLRVNAYLDAMQELFGRSGESDIYRFDSPEQLDDCLERLRASLPPGERSAIFGVNSVTTVRVYQKLKRSGMRIPQDIGLCGPDDWGWDSSMNWPNLIDIGVTTMTIPARTIGEEVAAMLLRRIASPGLAQQQLLLPTTLDVRASTLLG